MHAQLGHVTCELAYLHGREERSCQQDSSAFLTWSSMQAAMSCLTPWKPMLQVSNQKCWQVRHAVDEATRGDTGKYLQASLGPCMLSSGTQMTGCKCCLRKVVESGCCSISTVTGHVAIEGSTSYKSRVNRHAWQCTRSSGQICAETVQ